MVYGLVARTFAKACESLGIPKQSFSCQHKSHITKVMDYGTVGYCFNDDPEQGGTGYLIDLHRCQRYKVMQRKVSEQSVDALAGRCVSKGNPVKYNRGDLVLTDCNVTGSNYGTPTKPKFPLMALWHNVLLYLGFAISLYLPPFCITDFQVMKHNKNSQIYYFINKTSES